MQGIKERREMARERIWARIHLTPMLQAENDRDDVRRVWAAEERERVLMRGVEGWKVGQEGVYNSKRYVRVAVAASPVARLSASNPTWGSGTRVGGREGNGVAWRQQGIMG